MKFFKKNILFKFILFLVIFYIFISIARAETFASKDSNNMNNITGLTDLYGERVQTHLICPDAGQKRLDKIIDYMDCVYVMKICIDNYQFLVINPVNQNARTFCITNSW